MGQKLSSQPNAPLVWILRGQPKMHPNPEQPIKFQFKSRRKSTSYPSPTPVDCDDNLRPTKRTISTSFLDTVDDCKPHARPGKRSSHSFGLIALNTSSEKFDTLGYDVEDINQFLTKASLERPANIPVVLSVPTVLYQTRVGGYQVEIALPLGMVLNAVFRNQHWLYAQTPHGEEGYIAYIACIPLGIVPSADDALSPCWDTLTDVFPRPSGNLTDADKVSTCSEGRRRKTGVHLRRRRRVGGTKGATITTSTAWGENNVDQLYLRAASTNNGEVCRHTLLVVDEDYAEKGSNTLSVRKGDVVTLLSTHLRGWFWVRRTEGEEGYIPAAVAGYGYV